MNDPGLDKTIQESQNAVAHKERDRDRDEGSDEYHVRSSYAAGLLEEMKNDEDEEELSFSQPALWWFTSTAFPLVAGTFGPFANLFSVCAIVQSWRIAESDGSRIKDPPTLIATNAISLVFALAANLILFFNFAHRIPYTLAQSLTIPLWYISSILLIVPLSLTHTFHSPEPYALSQSFYYALISSVLYATISSLLLLNLIGACVFHAYAPSLTILTVPQRTLMLQTVSFSLFIALGGGVFGHIEGWGFLNGVYWADYTLLTIGLGTDFPLLKTLARMLLIPYAAIGITLIGLIVGSVRGLVLERGKVKVVRRRMGKEREKWLKRFRDDNDAHLARKKIKNLPKDARHRPQGLWKKEEYELMRYIERTASKVQSYAALVVSLLVFLFVWTGGALVFWSCEHKDQSWTYPESLYFAYTSLLTIGYGDFYPASNAGKPFFVLWSLIAVPTVTVLISNMGDTVVRAIQSATVWAGQKTVLPEKEQKQRKKARHRPKEEKSSPQHGLGRDVEELGGAVERAEEEQGRSESLAARLAREISGVARDVGKNPPIKYEWQEWTRWLELLGEGEGEGEGEHEDGHTTGTNGEKKGKRGWSWSWLGDEGPLFSRESETEWVLGRLCKRLEKVLEKELRER